MADIDIQEAVAVDIGDADAGAPGAVAGDVRLPGDILEFKVPFVKEQFIGTGITRKENIIEAVIVKICDAYAGSVIEVFIAHDVEAVVLFDLIQEIDAGLFFGHERE